MLISPINRFARWASMILRKPEDEGAGGASSYDGEGTTPAPDLNRVAALEARLGSMAQQMGALLEGQRTRDAQQQLSQFEGQLNSRVAETESAVTSAEAALAEAFDGGDGTQIARAQRVLAEAVTAKEQAKLNKSNYDLRRREEERRQGGGGNPAGAPQQQADAASDTTNLNSWKNRHRSWYGVDSDMTQYAHSVSDRIRNAGAVAVGSTEYFEIIDRELRNKFPDRLSGTPQTAGGGGGGGTAPSAGRGRIPSSVLDGWRRMGLNTADPKVVERLVGHRQGLVDKGILSAQPVSGPIKSY